MITRDNGNNYSELCAAATKILREHEPSALGGQDAPDLVDINDYFTVLGSMQKLVADKSKKVDPYFLILPGVVDEEPFKINANTRAIEVPAAFKNGVAVQGDNLAEVIYFSIDRYFDTTDLYYKDVFVQWEAPAQGLGQKDTGLTMCINKTARLIPGKVVFGWPIADSITKQPGTLKFSVRFFDRVQDKDDPTGTKWKLEYSFSTLTASLKINPGLDFDLSDDVTYNALLEDLTTEVQGLYKNSALVSGADYDALIPIFDDYNPDVWENAQDKVLNEYDLDDAIFENSGFSARALLDKNQDRNGIGTISYSWYAANDKGSDGELLSGEGIKELYIPAKDPERSEYDTYYTKNEDDSYTSYYGAVKDGKTDDENRYQLYHRGSQCKPSRAGYYYLQATNTAGRGNSNTSQSDRWYIKIATAPTITINDETAHAILQSGSVLLSPKISNYTEGKDKLTYTWYVSDTDKGEKRKVTDAEDSNTYTAIKEGFYFLNITNTRNGTKATAINETPMRVTTPPEAVTSINYSYNGAPVPALGASLINNAVLEVSYTLPLNDSMQHKWYKVDTSDQTYKTCTLVGEGDTFTPTQGGIYFVEITTKRNEHEAIFNSSELKENESYNNRTVVQILRP